MKSINVCQHGQNRVGRRGGNSTLPHLLASIALLGKYVEVLESGNWPDLVGQKGHVVSRRSSYLLEVEFSDLVLMDADNQPHPLRETFDYRQLKLLA